MSTRSQNVSDPSGPNAKYKKKYEVIFQGDLGFARKFMPEIRQILNSISLPKSIRDNEGTQLDFLGSDLTVVSQLQIGVRIRRSKFTKYDQFTQDDKERHHMTCDVYFFGYANKNEIGLNSWFVFDYKEYERQRGEWQDGQLWNIPCVARPRNEEHSAVQFNCYQVGDIAKHCKVYAKYGGIGWKD